MKIKDILNWRWKGYSVYSYKHPIWYDPKYKKERSQLLTHIEKTSNKKTEKK